MKDYKQEKITLNLEIPSLIIISISLYLVLKIHEDVSLFETFIYIYIGFLSLPKTIFL